MSQLPSLPGFLQWLLVVIVFVRPLQVIRSVWAKDISMYYTYQLPSPAQYLLQYLRFEQGLGSRGEDSVRRRMLIKGGGPLTHRDFVETFHYTDFNILRAGLNDLQQAFNRQLYRLVSCHVVLMVLFQEFSNSLRGSPDCICLASHGVNSAVERQIRKSLTFHAL